MFKDCHTFYVLDLHYFHEFFIQKQYKSFYLSKMYGMQLNPSKFKMNYELIKVHAPTIDKVSKTDFIFKDHTFLRHISMHTIDDCLKLKLSKIGSSTLLIIIR